MDVLAATASLIDKSLLRRSIRPDQTAEFSMLESLREYAAEQLAVYGELEATRSRHAVYFAELATQAAAGVGTGDETRWFDWMGYERENLAAALDHALASGDNRSALRLGAALGWSWYTRGYLGEGLVALDRVLFAAQASAEAVPDEVVAGTPGHGRRAGLEQRRSRPRRGAAAPGHGDQRGVRGRAPGRDRDRLPRPRRAGRRSRRRGARLP